MTSSELSPNSLALLALSNEYCHAVENAGVSTPQEFVDTMLHLLPRIYMSTTDLDTDTMNLGVTYIPSALDEGDYNNFRASIEALLGDKDTYLEVFENDMKYSDTPIAASISEELCDIYQELYNMLENCRDSTDDVINETLDIIKDEFASFWSQKLCNVLRALNALKYDADFDNL